MWWVALSAWPGTAVGTYWQHAFHGELAPDFTLSGDWAYVFIENYAGRPSGRVVYSVVFVSPSGGEQISLVRTSISGPPFPEIVTHLDYPAETLDRTQ